MKGTEASAWPACPYSLFLCHHWCHVWTALKIGPSCKEPRPPAGEKAWRWTHQPSRALSRPHAGRADILTAASRETSHTIPIPDPPKLWDTCCFKLLHLRVIFYTAIDNSSLGPTSSSPSAIPWFQIPSCSWFLSSVLCSFSLSLLKGLYMHQSQTLWDLTTFVYLQVHSIFLNFTALKGEVWVYSP